MPYVDEERKKKLDPLIAGLSLETRAAGDLSYVITRLAQTQLKRLGNRSYINMATVVGVMVLTVFEFVRRVVNPYEDEKIKKNGDVY